MSAPQTRRSPRGGAGFEVDQQIGFARQLYRGTTPPTTAPAPRNAADVVQELAEAATRLRSMAGGMRLAGPTPEAIADADRLVTGCGALLRELRQRVTPP